MELRHSRFIWHYDIPPKFAAFGFLVGRKKILTIDSLQKRSMILPNICLLCMHNEEIVDHLLMHCFFVRLIWADILGRFQILRSFLELVDLLLSAWHGVILGKEKKLLWSLSLLAIWWEVWEELNARCFNNISKVAEGSSRRARALVIEWTSCTPKLTGCNLDFLGL
ncbi:uncharacterized protein LOC131254337 [Magnolia sinica]|uniref:uncharacterized protein LOC131254337 n=1 Tax=Magnolia sinica TaxID=86752 RepID=UPI002659BC44|nr:uncharacterized protein LOC131254337 [Magnolia sinica]